jgi:murein L,D-transpeptidase YcbB/YkuD
MKYIVFRPYWEVPYSITVRELLPSIRSNPDYLVHQRLEMVGAAGVPLPATPENIEQLATGALRLRQQPGPQNSLGLAKFMLPNIYNVYLHDTPSQGLFARASRAFSHGCVRVADPPGLAQFILRDDATWNREKIEKAMNGEKPTQVNLRQPIRVFIVYGSAVVTEAGVVQFFDDIYGHDARLDSLIAQSRTRQPAQ